MQIRSLKEIAEDKWCNVFLSGLVVMAAVSAHIPVWHFKYVFLLCAGMLSVIAVGKLLVEGSFKSWIKANWIYAGLAIYMFVLITCKKLGQIMFGTMDSIIIGYGEAVYALFGVLFFGVFSPKRIRLFMAVYTAAFAGIFAVTGQYTLYDVGNVCRTISLYQNPNMMAIYAVVSLCFAILLAVWMSKWYFRVFYIGCAALSAAAIFNSSSRGMYFGLLAAAVLCCGLLLYYVVTGKIRIRINIKAVSYIGIFAVSAALFAYAYRPLPGNAIINMVTGENVQQIAPDAEASGIPSPEESKPSDETVLSGIDRITQEDGLTGAASAKTNIRWQIWKAYIENISVKTFFGSPPGVNAMYFEEYGREYAPHNIFIYMLFVHGVPAFVLFVLLMLHFVKVFFGKKNFSMYDVIIVSCVFAMTVYGMFHNLANIAIFWSCVGMVNQIKQK